MVNKGFTNTLSDRFTIKKKQTYTSWKSFERWKLYLN